MLNQGTDPNVAPNTQTVLNPPPNPFANPQTPSGFMNRDPNELAFLFNEESGDLEIGAKQPKEAPPVVPDPPKEQQPPEAKQPDNEERFLRIEQALATVATFLQGMQNGSLNNQPPQQTQQKEEAVDYSGLDMSDANTVVGLIKHTIKDILKAELTPLINKTNELGVKSSYLEAGQVHGDDFKAALPVIETLVKAGIMKSDPNMDFGKIVLTLKQAGLLKTDTAKTDSTIQPTNGSNGNGKPQSAQELVQRANALSTESPGVQRNFVNNNDKPVKTVDDAFEKAWQQVVGSR